MMKFDEFDMRSEFTIPVFVSYGLKKFGDDIEGIDPKKRIAGQLTKKNGTTYLDIADLPIKENYQSKGFYVDFEDKVQSQEDYGDWYASTWTGDLLFVIHKYLRVSVNSHVSFNGVGQETSSWIITDYDIVNQFMLSPNVYQVKVYMDYLHSWLNIFNPLQNLSDEKSILYKNLTFQAIRFSLLIQGQGNIAEDTHTVTKTANTCLVLKFDEPQKRERIYKLLKVLRNMFHILINKKIGISKIVLNADKSWDAKSQSLRKKDERENWILNQSFLPDNMDDKVSRPSLLFKDIKNDFGKLFKDFWTMLNYNL